MFNRILVPIDGSPNSYRSLEYAVDIAKKYGATITLIHIVEAPIYPYGDQLILRHEEAHLLLKEEGEKLLTKARLDLANTGIRVETILASGDPSEEILNASRNHDLIVMGSRGLGRITAFLLGSVSSGVSQHAKVPVLIVKPT